MSPDSGNLQRSRAFDSTLEIVVFEPSLIIQARRSRGLEFERFMELELLLNAGDAQTNQGSELSSN